MEVISTTQRLKAEVNEQTVTARVCSGQYDGNKMDEGQVRDASGRVLASWWLGREGIFGVTFHASTAPADRSTILSSIDTFIAEATAEE